MIMTKDDNKITRLMVLNIMQASKQEIQEQQVVEDFHKNEWYYEDFCEVQESTEDERILDRCTKLSIGVFRRQGTTRQ